MADKAKPVERQGRKVTGLIDSRTALLKGGSAIFLSSNIGGFCRKPFHLYKWADPAYARRVEEFWHAAFLDAGLLKLTKGGNHDRQGYY